jgi:hypothetical protein
MPDARRLRERKPDKHFSTFLNIPYDPPFLKLYLAYISGVTAFGLVPRATLEIPGSKRRLDRILELIQSCEYSIHDVSRVELDMTPPPTPRFNMPFELGLAVAWEKIHGRHAWYVCEAKVRRLQKSLSDLNGTQVYVHDGKVGGLFRELCNMFVRSKQQPSVSQMRNIYRGLGSALPLIMAETGAKSPYTARVFQDLCLRARAEQLSLS